MSFKSICVGAALGLAASFGIAPAQASLIGVDVGCQVGPDFYECSSATATVVDPGSEFTVSFFGDDEFEIDLGDSSVSLTYIGSGLATALNETLTLTDLTWLNIGGTIKGINSFFTDVTSGIDAGDITFGANSVTFDLNGALFDTGQVISFNVVPSHLPEPGTLAILGLGLLGFGIARRRRTT